MVRTRRRDFTLIELLIVILILGSVAAIAIPNILAARKNGNEAGAIGSLKAISTAQRLFREGDKEGDGSYDYGSLTELANSGLIDVYLGSGTKQGYNFVTQASTSSQQFVFWATADPSVQGGSGDKNFATNQAGVIYYTSAGTPIVPNVVDGSITGALPIQ